MELDTSRITENSRIVDELKPSFDEWTIYEAEHIDEYFKKKLKEKKMKKIKVSLFNKTSLYVGELNKEGNYHGIGRLLFNYGHWPEYYYIGEFVNGVEEGNGIYIPLICFKAKTSYLKLNNYAIVKRKNGNLKDLKIHHGVFDIIVNEGFLSIEFSNAIIKVNISPQTILDRYLKSSYSITHFKRNELLNAEYYEGDNHFNLKGNNEVTDVEYKFNGKLFFKGSINKPFNEFISPRMNWSYNFMLKYDLNFNFKKNNVMCYSLFNHTLTGYCEISTPEKGKIYEGTFKEGFKDGKGIEYDREEPKEVEYKMGFKISN